MSGQEARSAAHTDLEALVAACEEIYGSHLDGFADDEDVTSPPTGITFGMIRRARAALDSMRPVVDSDNIDGYDEGLPE